MRLIKALRSIFLNRCPQCHRGRVFVFNNPFYFAGIFKMFTHCKSCQLQYEREPGYFTGAMYVAYALTSGWFIVWFLLQLLWLDWPTEYFTAFILTSLVLLAPLTFRWSRLLWLNLFTKYRA
ncbi:MAG TPA: DUF983 domain-containing protein [Luteibaculaceae bacterium]|nr:DUF983 domain-containing protein [Luteibaculaceae bacterium]